MSWTPEILFQVRQLLLRVALFPSGQLTSLLVAGEAAGTTGYSASVAGLQLLREAGLSCHHPGQWLAPGHYPLVVSK